MTTNCSNDDIPYREGTWFAVPLRGGGYAVGVAARLNGRGCVFGYFFGPMRSEIPSVSTLKNLHSDNAILVTQFGDLGLIEGEWPIIGDSESWDRKTWPMPSFVRVTEPDHVAFVTTYSENTLEPIKERKCALSEVANYPYDSLSGAGAVEIRLTKLLTSESA